MLKRQQTTTRRFANGFSGKPTDVRRSRPGKTALRVECLEARLALSGLNLTFQVQNPDYNPSNTYVTFIDGSLSATYDGGKIVGLNHSYTISELNGPITLQSYTGGRIFVSYGAGVAGTAPPEMVNPAIPSYHVRHDKFEITYDPSITSVANLTGVDFFGIPLELNTRLNGTQVASLTYRISADTLISELAALAGDSSEVLLEDGSNFLRVLSPHTTTLSHTQYYPSMTPYIDAVRTWQTTYTHTVIEDQYSHIGTTPATQTQKYYFLATIEADSSLKLVGGGEKVGGGLWAGSDHTILVTAADLASGIYLGNCPWTVDGTPGSFADNDVYAAAVRDVIAAFNLGFLASPTIDPNTKVAYGQESSKYWWSATSAFDFLQTKNAYYNQYAKILTENSDNYGFAFSDRWNKVHSVQASLNGVDTLEVVVMADTLFTTTPGLYSAQASTFYLRDSNSTGIADTTFAYGPAAQSPAWTPIVGDWTGQGKETVGLYNPATSLFYLRNSNSAGFANITFSYGPVSSWVPLAGDWTGQGRETVGLYNPTTSTFYLRNTNTTGFADITFTFGTGDFRWKPLVGDWDGDGKDTVGLYDPTTSIFYLRNSNTTGVADITFHYGMGNAGWTPLAGDWTDLGKDTVGLFDPNMSTFYLKNTNTTGFADLTFNYGPASSGWTPIVGNWTGVSALTAADGAIADADVPQLAEADLRPIVDAAIVRWAAAGLDAVALAKLRQTEVVIGDLSGSLLGQADSRRIRLDGDAAGHGWFVDPTPDSDEEYAAVSDHELRAVNPQALDRIDLLTVVEHELGHIIGRDDLDALSDNLMSSALEVGVRRIAG